MASGVQFYVLFWLARMKGFFCRGQRRWRGATQTTSPVGGGKVVAKGLK